MVKKLEIACSAEELTLIKRILRHLLLYAAVISISLTAMVILPWHRISFMQRLELERNGGVHIVGLSADSIRHDPYGISEWSPVECILIMDSGERISALYDEERGIFSVPQRYSGCYVIEE